MTDPRLDRALLLARTTSNLRPSQVVHRVRLRALRWPPSRPVGALVVGALPVRHRAVAGWPEGFRPLDLQLGDGFPSAEDNARGRFRFLEALRDLGPSRWDAPGASRLWNYHLHYMEWAWSFAVHPDREWARKAFAELWRSWQQSVPFGRGDAWSPYVASLRAWALCGTYAPLVAGSDIQAAVDAALVRHARFLRSHLEHDVGGNHLLRNLKALIGLGVFLGDDGLIRRSTQALDEQIGVQILADGGHYERSPSYHCQVLGDLLDVAGLLAASRRPAVGGLAVAVDRMRTWLGVILMPDGDVPLLNDCALVGHARLSLLQPAPPPGERISVLAASGYVVVRPGDRLHLVADVGDPCPPDLPAHAHADSLTFELAVDGERLVVDTGTSTYEPGPQRAFERSTAAHNTLSIDGVDSTEVWGVFRAARLARTRLEGVDDDGQTVSVVASHDGYRRLAGRPIHRREWRVGADRLAIVDDIVGDGEHLVESRLHLSAPAGAKVTWSAPPDLRVVGGSTPFATGFGRLYDGHLVAAAWRGPLPVTLAMELHAEGPMLQGSSGIDGASTMKGTR